MLSPFHIRNLRPTQPKMTQDSLVRISAPGYDKTISTNPTARLKYQDEDDSAIITVGSSTELVQRLEEPVPQNLQGSPRSSRNPMSIATLLAESQQPPPSLTHHIFDIEDREEVRKLWQDIQEKNNISKTSTNALTKMNGGAKPLSLDTLENDQRLQVGKDNVFARAYDRLRPTIWTPLARELGISWREAENMHWRLGEDILGDRASAEMLESLASTSNEASDSYEVKASASSIDFRGESSSAPSPVFSDYRALHFNSTMPPQLRSAEPIGTGENHAAGGQMRSSMAAKPAANLTIEGKRQAQAAGDKLRARTMPSRHRKVAAAVDHTNQQNRWANYKSPSSAFFPKDDPTLSQSFDTHGLTSEGKRQAQVAGDKLRNRTNPIRHFRPSRGSVSEHGISKNRWSSYGPRVTRLDERRDSQAESSEKLLPGDAELSESKGQPSLLELFEVELAKKMTANDDCQENAQAIVSEVSTTTSVPSNLAVPAQEEVHQETNPLLNGLKTINNDLRGLALGDESIPQEFPRAIGQGFRAAIGGLGMFVRSVANGLQEASALTRQAAEHTREANLQAIDDTISELRTVAGEVTALSREILPVLAKTNEDLREDKVCSEPTSSDPSTITAETAESMLSESKVTGTVYTAPDEDLQNSFASGLERPVSVVKPVTVSKPFTPRQARPPKHVSEIPVSVTRSIRSDNRRAPRCTGMTRAPRYHKPGPIHLPHHSPLVESSTVDAQTSTPRSGYVNYLRLVEERDNNQSTNLPAAAARFPTLAQFEDQNFSSQKPFPSLPSMNMEPLVPLKPDSQSGSQSPPGSSQGLSEDQADNSRPACAAQNLLVAHGINPGNLSEAQFESFRMQSPAVQKKSIEIYAANRAESQPPQKTSTNSGAASGRESPVVTQDMDQDGIRAGMSRSREPPTVDDYQMQLKLLERQNKKRCFLLEQHRDEDTGEVYAQCRTITVSDVEESETELERPDGMKRKERAIARQERAIARRQEFDEILRKSGGLEGTPTSLSDVQAHSGIPPNSPKPRGVENDYSQGFSRQSSMMGQEYSEKRRSEAQEEKAPTSEPIEQPESSHSKSPSGGENSDHDSLLYQASFPGMTSNGQKTQQGRTGREKRNGASNDSAMPANYNTSRTNDKRSNDHFSKPCPSSEWKWECVREGCSKKFDTQQERSWHLSYECLMPRKSDIASRAKASIRYSVSQAVDNRTSQEWDRRRSHCPGFLNTPSASGMKLTCMAPECQKQFDTEKEASAHMRFETDLLHEPNSQNSAQGGSPSTRTEVRDRLTPQQLMSHGSSAARLVEPFDPLVVEPSARPHLTEGIRRNATVACTDSRLNARRRRPYSEAFDGNGRVEWDQFLKNVPNTQPNGESSSKRDESIRNSPVSSRRTLGSKFSFESDSKDHRSDIHRARRGSPMTNYDLPGIGYPKWHDGPRDVRNSTSPAPVTTARRPYVLRSDLRSRTDVPSPSSRSQAPAPTMHFESPEQKRKIQSCVMQLKNLGFGEDGVSGEERLMQCASAAGGDLVEAIDMIDEEQRAYKEKGMKWL
ncbi:hypothetical protein JMJ35_000065 [Cladonia borealis]|uniref:Uncharacterized protein n=1 Tax=Cladonia borealis TaxID=184061 RepID=A0AA39R8P2_9LECA|nr:hypothetical protein JMJ35_000065 [Cladonia borealis]